MGIELTTKNTGIEKVLYDGFCEQSIDSDITLPDYCPDIMRILKCNVQVSVTNSKIAGDRAIADGNAKIRIFKYPFPKSCGKSTIFGKKTFEII